MTRGLEVVAERRGGDTLTGQFGLSGFDGLQRGGGVGVGRGPGLSTDTLDERVGGGLCLRDEHLGGGSLLFDQCLGRSAFLFHQRLRGQALALDQGVGRASFLIDRRPCRVPLLFNRGVCGVAFLDDGRLRGCAFLFDERLGGGAFVCNRGMRGVPGFGNLHFRGNASILAGQRGGRVGFLGGDPCQIENERLERVTARRVGECGFERRKAQIDGPAQGVEPLAGTIGDIRNR